MASDIVGREEELASLRAFIEDVDGAAAFVLEGEAGIGKSTLWLAGVGEARERGLRVLSSRPSEAERGLALAGLGDLFEDVLDEVLPALSPPRRRALEVALLVEESTESADPRALGVAVRSAVEVLAAAGPILLAVDDVQWLDPSSSSALAFALRRLDEEPVLVLLARRLGEGVESSELELALAADRIQQLRLRPLSLGALHLLLRSRLGTPFARPALARVWETSGGNPFFALELARALEPGGGRVDPGAVLPIPGNLDELVHERVDVLTRPARDVARVVAVLAEPTTRLVEAAVGSPAARGLADAVDARVLEFDGERIRFSHPLLASATASRTPPAARRALHARLAELVSGDEERVRHLALAVPSTDSAVADALEAAARRARRRGAAAAAADLAEQALRLTPADDEAIRRRTVEAADHVFEAGDAARSIVLLEDALADTPPGPARASVLRRLATARTWATGPRDGVALYQEALGEAGGDHALEAEIHLELADTLRFTTGLASAEPHVEAAVRAAERTADPALLCKALAMFGLIHFKLGRGIHKEMARAVGLEESLGLPAGMWSPKASLCDQLFWSHDLDAARALAEEVREALRGREDPYEADMLWYLALIEWRAGSWGRAAELADAAVALDEQSGREGLAPVMEWPRALIAAHRGLIDEARRRADGALASAKAAGIGTAEAGHLWVLGFIDLSLGDPEAALHRLRPAYELRRAVGHGEPGQCWELPDLLDALVAVGDLDQADAVLAPWEERAWALDRAWATAIAGRFRALCSAARGDLGGALALFERALADHGRTQDPFQLARTFLALGTTQLRAKQRTAARETLARALGLFEELGAPLWAEKTRAELARIGGRTRSEDLTPAERRVAALVVEGRTNREVAAALFLGERTVESHLTHIYAKLSIRSRTELARRLN